MVVPENYRHAANRRATNKVIRMGSLSFESTQHAVDTYLAGV
jgi:hypothetical protein